MIVFVKTKLSKLLNVYAIGITSDESRWHESEAICLTCLSVCFTVPAVCGNEDRLLWTCLQLYPDPGSLETKFWEIVWVVEEKMGEFLKKSRSNISGMVWVTTTKLGLLEHTVNFYSLQFFFRCFRRGMVERSHPQFPEICCWANGVQLQGPPNDKFDFFTRNVEEKERKWRSRNFNFRIRADPLPPPSPQS